MATTRIMPLHIGKGRSVGTAVSDILEYVKDAEKTDQGRLVTCFQCNPEIADAEFCFSKRRYQTSTGRKQENDVIAYHVRQSFKPGEITPEEANRLGCEFAERFLKGNHAYMGCLPRTAYDGPRGAARLSPGDERNTAITFDILQAAAPILPVRLLSKRRNLK